jgi:hypothetical protein
MDREGELRAEMNRRRMWRKEKRKNEMMTSFRLKLKRNPTICYQPSCDSVGRGEELGLGDEVGDCVELDFRWNYRKMVLFHTHFHIILSICTQLHSYTVASFFSIIPTMNNTKKNSRNLEELLHRKLSNNPHVNPRGCRLGY